MNIVKLIAFAIILVLYSLGMTHYWLYIEKHQKNFPRFEPSTLIPLQATIVIDGILIAFLATVFTKKLPEDTMYIAIPLLAIFLLATCILTRQIVIWIMELAKGTKKSLKEGRNKLRG